MPAKIGPYQILETLHSGNRPFYKVKAADGRVLALKAISVAGLSAEMRERFTRETEICRTLDHPNLVRAYDAGEADGLLYQVMDLLEGSDLNAAMSSGRHFTWLEKLSIMEQVCDGLEYAHARNLVHRDIKPANLFLENSGVVRVLDFGMARVAESQLTKIGSTVGTLNYMSPEQIRGERCTAAADVFSAGIVFFQLASGRHPFSNKDRSLGQVVSAIVFEPPPKLSEICPDAPEGLEFLLNGALEKTPERRTPSITALKQGVMLCRITLSLTAPPAQAAAGAPAGEKASAPPAALDAPVPPDQQKTKVIRRDFALPPRPAASTPPPPPPVISPPPKLPPTVTMRLRYCPACASANPWEAAVCTVCNRPLVGGQGRGQKTKTYPWGLYVAITVAVMLAVALIVVLIVKR